MPNFKKLADSGGFTALGTSIPPQSPVAWSNFITGTDSGGHGIFDFIHRHPETMTPYLSTSAATAGTMWKVGKYHFPARSTAAASICCARARRSGQCSRSTASRPPSSRCRPTSHRPAPRPVRSAVWARRTFSAPTAPSLLHHGPLAPLCPRRSTAASLQIVELRDGRLDAHLYGPDNPFLANPRRLRRELTAYVDEEDNAARFVDQRQRVPPQRRRVERVDADRVRDGPHPGPAGHRPLLPAFGHARVRALRDAPEHRPHQPGHADLDT